MTHLAPMETTQGYVPPSVTQFGVFLSNKVGKLHELVMSFDESPDVQVCALSVHDASDHAVVRILTNNAGAARKILREHALAFSEVDVLVVELVGGLTLSRLCLYLLGAEINIRFSYPVMLRPNGTPTIALAVDDPVLAGQILRRKHFRLLGEGDLPKPDPGKSNGQGQSGLGAGGGNGGFGGAAGTGGGSGLKGYGVDPKPGAGDADNSFDDDDDGLGPGGLTDPNEGFGDDPLDDWLV